MIAALAAWREAGHRPAMSRFFRLLLWAALLFAVTMAVLPHPPTAPVEVNDKYQHMLAFGTLSALAIGAYPRMPLRHILERLSFLGAMIELVQSIPALRRDCDIMDWVADTAMILVVVGVVWLWRHSRRGRGVA
jgi:hypothetical protein